MAKLEHFRWQVGLSVGYFIDFFPDGTFEASVPLEKIIEELENRKTWNVSYMVRALQKCQPLKKDDKFTLDNLLALVYCSPEAKISVSQREYDFAQANYQIGYKITENDTDNPTTHYRVVKKKTHPPQ